MKCEYFDVHHVSFDMWLTLIRSNPMFRQKRDELFRDLFSISESLESISAHFKKWDVRFTIINEKTGKNLDAEEMLSIVLADLDHTDKFDGQMVREFFIRQEDLFFRYHPKPIEEKLPVFLNSLKEQDINISILSNTGFIKGKLLRQLMDHLGLSQYMSFQLYSDEISFSKPSGEAFSSLLSEVCKHRLTGASNILHIGDNSNADVGGATVAGMQSALINSNSLSLLNLNIYRNKTVA
jgi:putative hydrolase of the HAD superfamily